MNKTKKQIFIEAVSELFETHPEVPDAAKEYLETLKAVTEKEKPPFTENGAKVLQWMQDNYETHGNIFTAKGISDNMGLGNSRTVSGALRKLVSDHYVSKIEASPTAYSLTETGKICQITPPESRAD